MFLFRLNRCKIHIQNMDQQKNTEKITKPINIIWVEDDKFLSSILMKKFGVSGHNISLAKNSEETFDLLKKTKPDIFVLDISLPGESGFDILQKIRMGQDMKNTPVIVLSNTSKQSDIDKAKLLGAQKFLVKAAVSLDEIIKEVEILTK